MSLLFAEGMSPNRPRAWLGLMNPTRQPQRVRVSLLLSRGVESWRAVTMPPRERTALEIHTWIGEGHAFGTVVECETTCMASLVMWDRELRQPHTAVHQVTCGELR